MPQMVWESFQDAPYRPHLVVVSLDGPTEFQGETNSSAVTRLVEALGVVVNYSLRKDANSVQAAFERDADAERFSEAISARATSSAPQWVSQAGVRIDRVTQKRIITALKQLRLRTAGER